MVTCTANHKDLWKYNQIDAEKFSNGIRKEDDFGTRLFIYRCHNLCVCVVACAAPKVRINTFLTNFSITEDE